MEVLKNLNLNVSVWDNDTFGRNSFLGEVDLDLSEWDFRNTQINEYTLKTRVKASFFCRICVYYHCELITTYPPQLNLSGLSTDFNTTSLMSDGQQRTDESCLEIPATDVPQ